MAIDIEKNDENHEVLSDEWCMARDEIILTAVRDIKAAVVNTIHLMEEEIKAGEETPERMKMIEKWKYYHDELVDVQEYSPYPAPPNRMIRGEKPKL